MSASGLAPTRSATRTLRALPPRDTLLPRLRELLRPAPAAFALERSLEAGTRIDDLRVRLVEYVPGASCTVLYQATIRDRRHVAVARLSAADAGWAPAAATTTARAVVPIAHPVSWDAHLGASVHWYPHDPAMPVLDLPAPVLLALVGAPPADCRIETLQYRPGLRAVLRAGDVVIKAYADARGYDAGVRGLRLAGRLAGRSPLRSSHPAARVTAQPAIEGRPVSRERALAVAPRAGAMLRALHGTENPGLDMSPPVSRLTAAACSAALVCAVAPPLAPRVRRLAARLELAAPAGAPAVVSHGDFNVSQLLDSGGELVLLDFDEACLAAPALDVAAFAANLVSGREGDLDDAYAALEATVDGYGSRPEHLDWHLAVTLLRRASSPFRLHKKDWPARMAAIVDAAEAVLGR